MSRIRTSFLAITLFTVPLFAAHAAQPLIEGAPTVDKPRLLQWGRDAAVGEPDLTEETANRLLDLHGNLGNCDNMDLVLSTAGNYHMALKDMWQTLLLPRYGQEIKSWYYTTSPPIAADQIQNSRVSFGNLTLRCRPQVVVGPLPVIERLQNITGLTEGKRIKIFNNRGNVILVKKGNPKHIKTVWDLGRPNVRVVMPHMTREKNTFDNYSGSIYNIAAADPNPPSGWTAERLFNSIFNDTQHEEHDARHDEDESKNKWLTGERIHHREVPWSIAYGKADAGVLFYHLALDAVRQFPDLFEIVPLGGTADDPRPLDGNRVGAHFAIRIAGTWNGAQYYARERAMELFASEEFRLILERHGLARP